MRICVDRVQYGQRKNITLLTLSELCNIIDCTPNDIVTFARADTP
ncbi:MAG: helix-turn-helix domain-containing protein [Dorea sp.]|nr:helix-turn-helix domain-containing protein [Dorea sp.]